MPAVERAAAAQFAATRFAFIVDFALSSETIDPKHEHVWVAEDRRGQVVGFALAHPLDGAVHLHELDVHPDHARKGLGRRLIAAVAQWARERGATGVTLTTFRDIPWNAPFYARVGFRALAEEELAAGLREILRAEAAAGLPGDERICMRLDLG